MDKYSMNDMLALADEKGGVCLSQEYIKTTTLYEWECIRGHHFKKSFAKVKSGSWCPECSPLLNENKCRYIFEYLFGLKFYKTRKVLPSKLELDGYNSKLKIAFEYNGAQHYSKSDFFYKSEEEFQQRLEYDKRKVLECRELGITLIVIPYFIGDDSKKVDFIKQKLRQRGISFPDVTVNFTDFYKKNPNYERLVEHARNLGGKCLSESYHSARHKMKWECHLGHQWETKATVVLQGSWCPKCANEKISQKQRFDIKKIVEIATARNGVCLSDLDNEFKNKHSVLRWKCERGHVWNSPFSSIRSGSWCTECNRNRLNSDSKLKDASFLSNSKNGFCLSDSYFGYRHQLEWKCENNHIFKATLSKVSKGYWCRHCKGPEYALSNRKYSIDDMHDIATKRGGKCLSTRYFNSKDKLQWKCSQGHVWSASSSDVISGSWCAICSQRKRKTIYEMHEIAALRHGKCLSTTYRNAHALLTWECSQGHVFKSSPARVIHRNAWCQICTQEKRKKSITDMKNLAALKGGDCLSSTYINWKTKLLWKCTYGHTWEARPTNIQQGQWCPTCKHMRLHYQTQTIIVHT